MSAFTDELRKIKRIDGTRQYIPMRLGSISVIEDSLKPKRFDVAEQYRVKAEFGMVVTCRETESLQKLQEGDYLMRQVQESIAHAVYGEIQNILHECWPDIAELLTDIKNWEVGERLQEKLKRIYETTKVHP